VENPQKACLEFRSAKDGTSEFKVDFQFNPKEYTVSKSASWQKSTAKGAKKTSAPEFQGAEPRTMSLELFLDRDAKHTDVVKQVEQLFRACTPDPKTLIKNKPVPPFVVFSWGTQRSFPACVKKVSAKYTRFSTDGTPIRAVCTVDLEELPAEYPRQNPTSGGLQSLRAHTVVDGDSLPSIAREEFGDPAYWRAIATHNHIDDPFRLPAGTRLLLPAAEDAAQMV
jgi:nucleoid-associated protein YgaU